MNCSTEGLRQSHEQTQVNPFSCVLIPGLWMNDNSSLCRAVFSSFPDGFGRLIGTSEITSWEQYYQLVDDEFDRAIISKQPTFFVFHSAAGVLALSSLYQRKCLDHPSILGVVLINARPEPRKEDDDYLPALETLQRSGRDPEYIREFLRDFFQKDWWQDIPKAIELMGSYPKLKILSGALDEVVPCKLWEQFPQVSPHIIANFDHNRGGGLKKITDILKELILTF